MDKDATEVSAVLYISYTDRTVNMITVDHTITAFPGPYY